MSSNVIAINCGSSSLKFQLVQMPEEKVIVKGTFERIGLVDSHFSFTMGEERKKFEVELPDHQVAVQKLLRELTNQGIIHSLDEIDGVGHRVVHGGEIFHDSVLITDEVIEEIEKCSDLAPLHNPSNIIGINVFRKALPDVPAVAVFDTAFHQTMPEQAFLYSIPYEYYEKYGIRKYGFHGSSHKYVTQRAAQLLNRPIEGLRLISCHLGNGASIAAVEGGKSIDTSMGFTPLAGVAMGTRSGNIDPALIPYIMKKTNMTADVLVSEVLNKKSGMLGLSGISSDLRDLVVAAKDGNHRAEISLEIFASGIHSFIGSYAAKMFGVDAIIFTAGIGENSPLIRAKILKGLEFMGVYWDPALNQVSGQEAFLNYAHSPVKVLTIPTNEEIMIVRDVVRLSRVHETV